MTSERGTITADGSYEEDCNFCGELFFSPEDVDAHIEREHSDEDLLPDGSITFR